jgi:hypothetical protein
VTSAKHGQHFFAVFATSSRPLRSKSLDYKVRHCLREQRKGNPFANKIALTPSLEFLPAEQPVPPPLPGRPAARLLSCARPVAA